MALSGSFYTTVATGYRLQLEWTATQNITANQSTVTAKLYWMSLGSSYTVNSSATKTSAIQHDGGTFSTESSAGMADLNGNEKKLINTYAFTLTHNTDGTKSFSLDGYFDVEISLGGSYKSRIDLTETTFTLNTIPRESKLTDTTPSFTAGSDLTLAITRYSSTFHHEIEFYVGNKATDTWNWIKQVVYNSSETSKSSAFTLAEKQDIFSELNGGSTKDVKAVLQTFSDSARTDMIGSNDYFGTVTAPSASTTTTSASFNIGDEITFAISRADTDFTHTLRVYLGTTLIHTSPARTATTSYKWTPTSTEITNMYNATKTVKTIATNIEIDTFCGTSQVKTTQPKAGTATVTGSNPTFGTGYTYADTNTTVPSAYGGTAGLTGDPTKIIQNQSTVTVTIPTSAKATANNGADMTSNGAGYIATLNGVQKTATWSSTASVTFVFGVINASVDQTLTIKAVDSRGNSTTTTKTVTMIPYTPPVLVTTAKRTNGFDNATTLTLNGTVSLVTVGTPKNSVQTVQYRYKIKGATGAIPTWDTWSNFTYSTSTNTYTATSVAMNSPTGLDNTKAWDIEVKVTDKLGSTTTPLTVATGQPIMMVDSKLKSLGVNMFPVGSGNVEINTGLGSASNGVLLKGTNVSGTLWTGTGGVVLQSNGTANLHLGANNTTDILINPTTNDITFNKKLEVKQGLDMNNTNIVGANGIYFDDDSTMGEGINFAKTTTPAGSTANADYHTFWVDNSGTTMLNGVPIAVPPNATALWAGSVSYMNSATSGVTPSKKLSQCANGWILCWSDYNAGQTPTPEGDFDFVLTYIHKRHVVDFNGKTMTVAIPNYDTSIVLKALIIYDDKIWGDPQNDDATTSGSIGNPNDVVLRRVWEW